MSIENLKHGAVRHAETPTPASHILASPVVDFTKKTNLSQPPDEDQGTAGSCTSQADGYYLWQLTGQQVSRNDTYSHTFLPGGGAYLDSPGEFVVQTGFLNRVPNYPDPNPQTEENMEHIILAEDAAGRIHAYSFIVTPITADINTIGSVLEQYKGAIIGVNGNDAGWQNLSHPTYNGQAVWGHALYVYDRTVINGMNALVAKSSWCNEVKIHYIDENYFTNGGVFEALVYENFKEIMTNVQFVHKTGTQEYGFYVPALSPSALQDKAANFDLSILNADGSINFTDAVEVSGLK